MSSLPSMNGESVLLDSHEERLQRMESTVQDLSTNVASLTERVEAGFNRMTDKFDEVVAPMAVQLQDHIKEDAELRSDVKDLQVAERVRRERWHKTRKALWAILAAGAGILLDQFAVNIFHYLTRR